jgi:hypothetical protein
LICGCRRPYLDCFVASLLIRTRKDELEGVLVEVKDAGLDVAPANVERMFEHFYTTKPDGLGWDCVFTDRSSNHTMGDYGRLQMYEARQWPHQVEKAPPKGPRQKGAARGRA